MFSVTEKETSIEKFMQHLKEKNPGEPEFLQAVHEIAQTIIPYIEQNPKYQGYSILERLTEPDRAISFRVNWVDDKGRVQVNKGYRIQFSNVIGPYKGGLRFHPSVNLSILKFLGFEQIFKNSLTTLPMGGAKGGSDFDPKGKSDGEVMRFCQAFMTELSRHIGPKKDVPAGDIGVGKREIGFLFGQYKRLINEFTGVLTGKDLSFGGSLIRMEATGYGCVYFMEEMLANKNDSIEGKKCIVSGSGNVAIYTAEKILQLGGSVHTLSDSDGCIYDVDGINFEKLQWIKNLKFKQRGRIKEYAEEYNVEYKEQSEPWGIPCDLAFPCATENELNESEAKMLIKNGCIGVAEGANMPTTTNAIHVLQDAKILYAPGKASNAGGVATSGLEMSQNSLGLSWTREMVDERLRTIMKNIHEKCIEYGKNEQGDIDYLKGANIAAFVKVANALIAQGVN